MKYTTKNLPENGSGTPQRNSALLAIANELALKNQLEMIKLYHMFVRDDIKETGLALIEIQKMQTVTQESEN